ncbi:hypothetical protein [Nitrospirillum sp. BR 11163]|uniref:hypothetical protein n=1 Tax=Nitrospirillum sp. BR 11163 TaxID=3104323 RepID=UPI002AFEEB72|nr:hypothetical protein [Nitrospirillum sp. BR 11163]MEA1673811.1 hypothetical protein [Nitrospirillum sp. BR 11163]
MALKDVALKPAAALAMAAVLGGVAGAQAKVTSIAIELVTVETPATFEGKDQDKVYSDACAHQKLTDAQALKWFRKAHEEPRQGFNEKATETGCVFRGSLTAKDGKAYRWTLDVGGTGYIFRSDERNDAILLTGAEVSFGR